MANPFLTAECTDVETALLYEKAVITDIGDKVACTDGKTLFLNNEENLRKLLPIYNTNVLRWLLWHEQYHVLLKHHPRYQQYEAKYEQSFERPIIHPRTVNIIMDILVHDSLIKMFPDTIPIMMTNGTQFREHNILEYTFKTYTLEEMLDEYLHREDKNKEESNEEQPGDATPSKDKSESSKPSENTDSDGNKSSTEPSSEYNEDERTLTAAQTQVTNEFLDPYMASKYKRQVEELKKKQRKLTTLTQKINGLVTSTRRRSYAMPSMIQTNKNVLLKGRTPGRTPLALCFDASGSMGEEMELFKDIITQSIPQAQQAPTTWFGGENNSRQFRVPGKRSPDYYAGTFKDFLPVKADSGYGDDGDRTIELCYEAELKGYSPIGVTDGGGKLSWSKPLLEKLKRTTLVGPSRWWLTRVKEVNPNVQIIICDDEE